MKAVAIIAALVLSGAVPESMANVGVFSGFGHSIQLSATESVQLVSEEVTIVPGRGPFLFDGGIQGMDRVEFDCVFVLRNLKNRKLGVQVGFPLNSQFPGIGEKDKTMDLVARYKFISQMEGHQYTVRHVSKDKGGKFQNLFLWDMNFGPNETKTLRVTYTMPISMALDSTAINKAKSRYEKKWYQVLEGCFLEWFGYVTETGKSWAGPIEDATFQIYLQGFEDYLHNRAIVEGQLAKKLEKSTNSRELPLLRPVVFRLTVPDGWKTNHQGPWRLSYKNHYGGKNLLFYYYFLTLPQTMEDTERLMVQLSRFGFASDEDYLDLKDILREYNGQRTDNPRIKNFLANQVWYGREIQQAVPKEVIMAIERK